MATRLVSRGRLPSFDVQKETRAALAAAQVKKQLPVNFGDIQGLVVTEKNTFINFQAASAFEESDCDRDLTEEPSPVLPRHDRKVTEGILLPPVKERRMSCIGGARARRSSCPPRIMDEVCHPAVFTTYGTTAQCGDQGQLPYTACPVTPNVSTSYKDRRHYSIDLNGASGRQSVDFHCTPISSNTSPLSVKPIDETCTTLPSTPTESEFKTTVMLRNVPYGESQLGVLNLIEERGFSGRFNFFYAPLDFSSGNNLGYAFINLPKRSDVEEFYTVFDQLRVDKEGWSQKDLQVCWARVQGSDPNVEHYRNSPVNDMPENFRPMIFENGKQLPFPRPDENVPRRPIPTTSMYSGNRATNRPRFASAHYPSNGTTSLFPPQRRKVSFHRPPTAQ